ncbi:surface lipoprotein assembly modifier [Pseudorhodobacter sp. W20_MBD10_FR17]|uniref:surface lipoprotein assembly modifier n=1 Tax=Pseudorhodobacter sp. W20_MBD10_FR17 TaxID=3240266 RepID=UPI003F9AFFB3
MRTALISGLVATSLVAALAAAQTDVPEGFSAVSQTNARQMGLEAIRQGRPDSAAKIALALLKADPTDSFALFMMATSLSQLEQPKAAEKAAKQSYRHAKTPEQEYQSSYLAANLAFQRGALMTAQWWLRKSAEAAPDEARKAKTVELFRAVRARNPWRINLAFSARPSDNVNNGSSGKFNIIDGLPFVGALSADAQAVKGVVTDGAVSLSYRLRQTEHSETVLGTDLSVRRVHLSSADKARLGGDPGFGSNRIGVTLRQDWQPKGSRHRFSVEGEVGRQTYESGRDYSFYGLSLGHRMPLASDLILASSIQVEQRSKQDLPHGDRSFGFRSTLLKQRANQDMITFSLSANRFDTQNAGRSANILGAQVGYTLANPIGTIALSASFGVQKSSYAGYALAGMAVPGGRSDTTGFGEMQFQFNEVSYAGFAPVLKLRHEMTHSNVSRFEAKETSLVVDLASKF